MLTSINCTVLIALFSRRDFEAGVKSQLDPCSNNNSHTHNSNNNHNNSVNNGGRIINKGGGVVVVLVAAVPDKRDVNNNNQTSSNQGAEEKEEDSSKGQQPATFVRDSRFHHITMASEDLLQPGHIVKERWKVVRPNTRLFFTHTQCMHGV